MFTLRVRTHREPSWLARSLKLPGKKRKTGEPTKQRGGSRERGTEGEKNEKAKYEGTKRRMAEVGVGKGLKRDGDAITRKKRKGGR